MKDPGGIFDLALSRSQGRLREAETRQLAMAARQQRASYLRQLLRRLVTVARQRLQVQVRPKPAKPTVAGTNQGVR